MFVDQTFADKAIKGVDEQIGLLKGFDESRVSSSNVYLGKLLEVDLPDEQIERFLDWDAKFKDQPSNVKKAVMESYIGKEFPDVVKNFTGEQIYNRLVGANVNLARKEMGDQAAGFVAQSIIGGSRKEASRALNELGVPGLKYWDGGSRKAASGTRNFVVFDPKIANITDIK